jgi:heme/copper-type cytochrome/quinol oxidase subunit 2
MYIYLIIIVVVITLIGVVATIKIANSTENKEENPSYDKNTGAKWVRLSVYYVVAIAISFVAFLVYISK